jgi:hypothetical protein
VYDLLDKSCNYDFDRILLVLGNDYLHVDNEAGTTTGGTIVDTDTRYRKIFRAGLKLICDTVETIRHFGKQVDIMFVPGNHDRLSSFHLNEVVSAIYESNEQVHVDNSLTDRKYYVYGNNGFMFLHGDKMPKDQNSVPLIMATENAVAWAAPHKEIHTGHLHQKIAFEKYGVMVRTLSSLSATDSWHHQNGYIGNKRSAEMFVYHERDGLVATFNHFAV